MKAHPLHKQARLSQKQIRARQAHLKVIAQRKISSGSGSGSSVIGAGSSVIGNREADTTKETLNQRVSLPDPRTREGSPHGEAACSRSSDKKSQQQPHKHARGKNTLLGQAQALFSLRSVLYSFDVHGRRSPIDTSRMSEESYQQLFKAARNPLHFDGSDVALDLDLQEAEPVRGLAPGYRLGPETGLPIPEWWDLPGAGASIEEIKATLRQNLEQANKRQKGSGWKRALGRTL